MNLLPLFLTCYGKSFLLTAMDDFSKFADDDAFASECYRLAGKKVPKKHRKNKW